MVFSSPIFMLAFLPIVYLLYLIFPVKARNGLLLLASLVFYGWGEPVFVLLMLLVTIFNYFLARSINWAWHQQKYKLRIGLFAAAMVFNLGTLAIFKYADFIIRTINQLFSLNLAETGIPLPIGISFFIFQAMSYVIDVYRRETQVQKRVANLMLYISFFPQLIAGPIIKYHDIADQITQRSLTLEKTTAGLRRFIIGLAKKLLIANYTGQIADQIFALPNHELTMAVGWLGGLAYMLQIYFDFSGYSDMAIGLGKIFGFDFKENFNYPYLASSLQDFWRRWHISLSTWFKEYLYIPLGGNQRGTLRTGLNRVVVFFLTGLWHGASWTFVVWGLVHGLFLLLETYQVIKPNRLWRPLRHLYTLLVVFLTFVIFRAESFTQALAFFRVMFSQPFFQTTAARTLMMQFATIETLITLLLAALFSLPVVQWLKGWSLYHGRPGLVTESASYLISLILLIICLMALATASYNPFIYFRF